MRPTLFDWKGLGRSDLSSVYVSAVIPYELLIFYYERLTNGSFRLVFVSKIFWGCDFSILFLYFNDYLRECAETLVYESD